MPAHCIEIESNSCNNGIHRDGTDGIRAGPQHTALSTVSSFALRQIWTKAMATGGPK
jgi:hypothetical protein